MASENPQNTSPQTARPDSEKLIDDIGILASKSRSVEAALRELTNVVLRYQGTSPEHLRAAAAAFDRGFVSLNQSIFALTGPLAAAREAERSKPVTKAADDPKPEEPVGEEPVLTELPPEEPVEADEAQLTVIQKPKRRRGFR